MTVKTSRAAGHWHHDKMGWVFVWFFFLLQDRDGDFNLRALATLSYCSAWPSCTQCRSDHLNKGKPLHDLSGKRRQEFILLQQRGQEAERGAQGFLFPHTTTWGQHKQQGTSPG